MSQYVPEANASPAIERREQLIEAFAAGAKPRDQWRIGTEYEKVAVCRADGRAAPFSGGRGIEAVLRRLADRYGWEPVEENGRVVALGGRKASVTLEPGGQLELSGQLCDSVHCAQAEFAEHIAEVVTVAAKTLSRFSRSPRTSTPISNAKITLVSRKAATRAIGAWVNPQTTKAKAVKDAPPAHSAGRQASRTTPITMPGRRHSIRPAIAPALSSESMA